MMRLPRFSLRTLLIVVTVACLVLGWRVKMVRDVDRSVATLRRSGFRVTHHWPVPPMTYVQYVNNGHKFNIRSDEPSSFWHRVLYGEDELEWTIVAKGNAVTLSAEQRDKTFPPVIDDAAMRGLIDDLQSIGQISILNLQCTAIGAETLRHLSSVRRLRSLDICETGIDDRGLAHLESMTWLEYLHVGNLVPDAGADKPTRAGVTRLRNALPTTEIRHWGEAGGNPSDMYLRPYFLK